MINIKPYGKNPYHCNQSKYPTVPKVPVRSIILGPSGSGKGILLQNLILEVYKCCFERIYIWSPSIEVDKQWDPVKEFQRNKLGVNDKAEKLYFQTYEPEELDKVIETQSKVILKQKQNKHHKLFSILIVIDDFADDASFSRHSKLLNSLFTRGRHNSISTIVSSQKYNALSPMIRVNATSLFVFRLRSMQDLEIFLIETGAILKGGKQELFEIYNVATKEQYSFLYINLTSNDINNMFYKNFNEVIRIED